MTVTPAGRPAAGPSGSAGAWPGARRGVVEGAGGDGDVVDAEAAGLVVLQRGGMVVGAGGEPDPAGGPAVVPAGGEVPGAGGGDAEQVAADPLAEFINRNPSVVMLALGFLLMIGMTLIADGFGVHVPKAYIYAAMGFSAAVEALNMLSRGAKARVDRHKDSTAN